MAGFTATQAWGPGVNAGYDLWFPAIAAEAAARCGISDTRAGLYELLASYAGDQVGCGARVAYCGAVDDYLGLLATAKATTTSQLPTSAPRPPSICDLARPCGPT